MKRMPFLTGFVFGYFIHKSRKPKVRPIPTTRDYMQMSRKRGPISDVLIPSMKDMLADMITVGVERVFFGDIKSAYNRRSRTSYTSYSQFRRSNMFDTTTIVLPTRTDAEQVLETLCDLIIRHEFVTVEELNNLVSINSTYKDSRVGWTDLRESNIIRVEKGYMLDLPVPQPIEVKTSKEQ